MNKRISLEIIPPRNLDNIAGYLTRLKPLLSYIQQFSITCHEPSNVSLRGRSTTNLSASTAKISGYDRSLAVARELKANFPQVEIIFHLTCYNLRRDNIDSKLHALKNSGVKGLLIVTGEGYRNEITNKNNLLVDDGSFRDSLEVVSYITQNHFRLFKTIAVSGYPDGHPDSLNRQGDTVNLKQKIDAGANLILTQCVYSIDDYRKFLLTITSHPSSIDHKSIRPTICLYESLKDLQNFASVARVNPPMSLVELLATATSEDQVIDIAYRSCLDLSRELLKLDNLHLHISPINRFELALKLLKELTAIDRSNEVVIG